ncbi:MAG: hypothetical protein ACTSU8_05985 [Alphaproteobacteria bacterium]
MKPFILFAFLVFASPALAEDESGLAELIGIPVMDGLTEAEDARLVFDKPGGRIVHARFGGSVSAGEVITFYRETLFQLGWVPDNESQEKTRASFTRENERLIIIITRDKPLEVTLDLGPSEPTS